MSNETIDDISGGINAIGGSAGRIVTQQVELVTYAIKSVTAAVEPLAKNALELTGNVFNALNETVKNVSTAIAPKA